MKIVIRFMLGTAIAGAAVASGTPAQANTFNYCVDGTSVACLYYGGSEISARSPISSNVTCFDNCSGVSNITFWDNYQGAAGLNQQVRNNTAAIYNNDPNHVVVEYVYPNYAGTRVDTLNCNDVGGTGGILNWNSLLNYTWNNNASQQFVSGCI